jgi:hypothetical protein
MDWEAAINESAHQAELFVFLVSDDFLSSGYCLGKELKLATEKFENEKAAIVSVIVRDCFWEIPQLARFQVLPEHGDAVGQKDKVWRQVVKELKASIDKLRTGMFFTPKGSPGGAAVPALLPHLCGREAEERQFVDALKAAPRQRPFVCIVTGAGDQGHSEFIDRLIAKAGETLGIPGEHAVYDPDPPLLWGQIDKAGDIPGRIAAMIDNPNPAGPAPKEIAFALAAHPGLMAIRSTWISKDWRRNTGRLLKDFLVLWDSCSWPDVKPNQHLIVFLSVKFLEPQEQPANAAMAAELAKIQTGPSLIKLALTSLTGKEVGDWLSHNPDVNENYDKARIIANLREIIAEDQDIPMEVLAPQLSMLLLKYRK